MKKVNIILAAFILLGCNSDMKDEFENFPEKLAKNDFGSSGGGCPVGRWSTSTCNGKAKLIYYFDSDGNGYSSNPECTGMCSPIIFRFRYTINGSSINYSFTSADNVNCGGQSSKPNVPSGSYSITYKCEDGGNRLVTETSNINTGQRSTTIFQRD